VDASKVGFVDFSGERGNNRVVWKSKKSANRKSVQIAEVTSDFVIKVRNQPFREIAASSERGSLFEGWRSQKPTSASMRNWEEEQGLVRCFTHRGAEKRSMRRRSVPQVYCLGASESVRKSE